MDGQGITRSSPYSPTLLIPKRDGRIFTQSPSVEEGISVQFIFGFGDHRYSCTPSLPLALNFLLRMFIQDVGLLPRPSQNHVPDDFEIH